MTDQYQINAEQLRSFLERYERWGSDMKWQPIETAPEDGTEVLVYVWVSLDQKHDMAVAAWRKGMWDMFPADVKGKKRWREFGCPTHWMPLPEPPNA